MLQTQVVPIVLGQGLDTKTDPKQLSPGKLTALTNGMFDPGKEIVKRPGFSVQPAGPTIGVAVQSYNNELISLDGQSLWSLSQGQNQFNNKGTVVATQLATTTIVRDTYNQTIPDSAINGSYRCYAWVDSQTVLTAARPFYSVIDTTTGQTIVNNTAVDARATLIKILALGTNFVIIWYDDSAQNLFYRTISTSTPSVLGSRGTIATDINVATPQFDASSFNSHIYIAYPNNSGTKASLYSMATNLSLSTQANVTVPKLPNVMCVFGDASNNVWVGHANSSTSSTVSAFILNSTLSGTVLINTAVDALTNTPKNINGYVSGTTAKFYYELGAASYVSDTLTPNFIKTNTITIAGGTGASSVFIRGCGLASKVFTYSSSPYFWVAVQSQLQNTYFLLNSSAVVCAKLSPGVGGGYLTSAILPEINTVSSGVFQTASLIKDNLTSQSGTVFTQTGVISAQITFSPSAPSKFVLGNNLHISGGLLQMYDGGAPVEHGYNIFPETPSCTFSGTGGNIGFGDQVNSTNQFQYQSIYEWVDNQGQIHRSAPNPAITVKIPSSTAPIIFSGSIATSSSTITLSASVSGLTVGMYIGRISYVTDAAPGTDFDYNCTVTTVSGTVVTLSGSSGAAIGAGTYSFVASPVAMSLFADDSAVTNFWTPGNTVAALTRICGTPSIGQVIFGLGSNSTCFPSNTYITAVSGTNVTVNNPSINSQVSGIVTPLHGLIRYLATFDNGIVTVKVPTLKLTQKANVSIAIYRTQLNQDIFYRVTSPTALTYSLTGTDSVTYTDSAADNVIIGNEQLYTTGGEVENIEVPAVQVATTFKSRAIVVPSENQLSWWYAKQVIQGVPVEFNDSFVQSVDARIGKITSVGTLDDKIIFFGPNSKYYVVGDGPAASGLNNDFTYPQRITGSTGCQYQSSLLETPEGLIYQDATKGIYLLDRSLQERYIGSDVEQYNSGTITSAQLVPSTTRTRLTLGDGTVLTYDYFYNQWGVDVYGTAAVDSTIFANQYTWISASGTAFSETSGTWTDNGTFIPLSLTTGWMNLGSIQGFMRTKKLMVLGTYFSPHTLNVNVYIDYNDTTPVQVVAIPVLVAPTVYQYEILLKKQKCQAIKLQIYDTQNPPYGQGFSLSSLAFEVGVKRGTQKLPVAQDY